MAVVGGGGLQSIANWLMSLLLHDEKSNDSPTLSKPDDDQFNVDDDVVLLDGS